MADGAVAGWLDGFAVPHAAIEAQVAAARDRVAARGSDTAIEDAAAAIAFAVLHSVAQSTQPLANPQGDVKI